MPAFCRNPGERPDHSGEALSAKRKQQITRSCCCLYYSMKGAGLQCIIRKATENHSAIKLIQSCIGYTNHCLNNSHR